MKLTFDDLTENDAVFLVKAMSYRDNLKQFWSFLHQELEKPSPAQNSKEYVGLIIKKYREHFPSL